MATQTIAQNNVGSLNFIQPVVRSFASLSPKGASKMLRATGHACPDQGPSRAPRAATEWLKLFSCFAAARAACVSTWLGEGHARMVSLNCAHNSCPALITTINVGPFFHAEGGARSVAEGKCDKMVDELIRHLTGDARLEFLRNSGPAPENA